MACVFRRAIARRIVSTLKYDITCEEETAVKEVSSWVKVHNHKTDRATLTVDWNLSNKLCQKSKELNSEVLSSIRGQKGLIFADGIENITHDESSNILRFGINQNYFVREVLRDLQDIGEKWKERNCLIDRLLKQNVIVEFSSPNIAKVFHVGHLRSTIIGNVLSNVYEFLNHKVTRINYLGDWGTQYGLLNAGYDKFGSDEELEKDPLRHLYSVYVAANNEAKADSNFSNKAKDDFNRLEKNDQLLFERWKKFRDFSVIAFEKTYNRLGIRFDVMSGESFYQKSAKDVVEKLLSTNLAERTSDGSVTIRIPYTSADEKELPIAKRDGSSLYLSRDVAAAIDRKKTYNFDKMFYVVDNRQSDYFVCVKNVLQKMGHDWQNTLHHIKFGLIRGMSSRSGKVILLDDLLNEAQIRARKNMDRSPNTKVEENADEVADILGISGLIVHDLSRPRMRDYDFTWEDALAYRRNSGIALQYTHARLCGLERENDGRLAIDCETNVLQETEALLLVLHLSRFDEVLCETIEKLEPHVLVSYLFQLSLLVGSAYKVLPVKGQDRVTAKARLLLFHAVKEVLKMGMKLIGLKPLEKM